MLERITRYIEKQITHDTWDDGVWYVGCSMYMLLGKNLDSTIMLYSSVLFTFLLLGYNIYFTIYFCRKREKLILTWKMIVRLCWRHVFWILLACYIFIALSEANAHAAALDY